MQTQVKQYLDAKKAMDDHVERSYPEGLILKWKYGKYAGRECYVKRTTWDVWKGECEISILVKTRTANGKAFMESNDRAHRTYINADKFEIVRK